MINRIKDAVYAIVFIALVLFIAYHLAVIPKAHGQSNEDKLFARHDSLFVKLQDGREFFAGETQKVVSFLFQAARGVSYLSPLVVARRMEKSK